MSQNSEQTIETDERMSEQDMIDLLHLDPLDSGAKSVDPQNADSEGNAQAEAQKAQEEGAGQTPPEQTGQEDGQNVQPAPGNQQTDQTPAQQPQTYTAEQVRQLVADELQRRSAPQQQQAAPQQNDAEKLQQELLQKYQFQLPNAVYDQLEDDDPVKRRQAFNQVLGAVAMAAHQNVYQQVQSEMNTRFENVPQTIQQALKQRDEAQKVFTDFYGNNPDLNKPELYPFVQQVGQKVMQETGINQWTPQLRDAVASRVRQVLGISAPQTQKQVQPQVPDLGGGSGPSSRPSPAPSTDEPVDILRGLM